MVGRFINHEGKQRNTPATRFGNIAMMPLEPILHPRGILQESFVVESRSLPGYSGSPVFVYSTPFSPRPNEPLTNITFEFLLGIDWGHNRTHEEVRDKNDEPIPEGWRVRSNSGMMNVVPAWRFNDLLNLKEFEMYRKEQDKELKKKKKSSTSDFDAETGSKPFTKEDFEQALKKASKPKSDEEKKQ